MATQNIRALASRSSEKFGGNFIKLGTEYGGWHIPENFTLHEDDVCYLAGAGEDISFDCALAMRFHCQVHIFDPTPRAIAHYQELCDGVGRGASCRINKSDIEFYDIDADGLNRIRFHPVGLSDKNEDLRFYVPANPAHVSHSILNLQKTDAYFTAPCKNVRTICSELGHAEIALLKIDIEGAEYQVIHDMAANGPLPRLLLVEFDECHSPLDGEAAKRIMGGMEKLQQCGMIAAHINASNVTFININK